MQQQQEQQHNDAQYVLRAAARMAYGSDSPVKHKLAQRLLHTMSDPHDPSTMSVLPLDAAAAACQVPASALLAMLRTDSCFRLKQQQSSNSSNSNSSNNNSCSVALNAELLLQKGRRATKAGVLAEELPPPVGWVGGQHPIRPGAKMCYHWENYGRCDFNRICVYNHSENPPATKAKQQRPSKGTSSREAAAAAAAAPSSSHRHNSSSGDHYPSTDFHYYDEDESFGSRFQRGGPETGSGASAVAPTPAAESASFSGQQQQAQQQQQQQQMVSVVSTGPSRPGAARCHMLLLRGFCPQGERCPFDHPPKGGSGTAGGGGSADVAQAPAQLTSSSYAAAATARTSEQQQQQQPAPVASKPHQQQQQQSITSQQSNKRHRREFPPLGLNSDGYPMFRGAPNCGFYLGTGRCDFADRCKFHHPDAPMVPACVFEGCMPRKFNVSSPAPYALLVNHLQRLWDYEDGGIECQLKVWLAHHLLARENKGCRMFSPTACLPAVEEGSKDVPWSRDKPRGAYSCTLKEAEQVLQLLWKAQPHAGADAADSTSSPESTSPTTPLPYRGQLPVLLDGDAYFQLLDAGGGFVGEWGGGQQGFSSSQGGGASSAVAVKLRVQEIKKLLNF